MPVVPLVCPLCAGLLQIDTALAGQQVGCPLCQGTIALPPAEVLAGLVAPPPPSDVIGLACPVCTGPFQVPLELAGQQVCCPHCTSAVLIPPLDFVPAAEFTAPVQDEPPPEEPPLAEPADPLSLLPPPVQVSSEPAPPPRSQVESWPSASDRLPPGMKTRRDQPPLLRSELAPEATASERVPPTTRDRLPPGARAAPPASAPVRPSNEDRLPPSAAPPLIELPEQAANPPVEDLLPPGAESPPTIGAIETLSPPSANLVDALLPPGAIGPAAAAAPGEQVAIPAAPKRGPLTPVSLPPGVAAVPTADGGFVTIKESPKTIGQGDDEVEVRRLSPAEKSARRFRRNMILWGVCLAILLGVIVAMIW